LNTEGLSIQGFIELELPLITWSEEQPVIRSENTWLNFDYFQIFGSIPIQEGQEYVLLEPFGFKLDVLPGSRFLVDNQSFGLSISSQLRLPEKFTTINEQPVSLLFDGQEDFSYWSSNEEAPGLGIMMGTMNLKPFGYALDLSESRSSGFHSNEPGWKGLEFESFKVQILDQQGFIPVMGQEFESHPGDYAFVDGEMNLHFTKEELDEDVEFQTFPASLDDISLQISRGSVLSGSFIRGRFIVPFLSIDDALSFRYDFSNMGWSRPFIDDLIGKTFLHEGEDSGERVEITIQRAVLEDNSHLDLTVDINWKALDLQLHGLRSLKLWGNYNVGFYTPEGLFALDQQVESEFRGYPVIIDGVAIGRSKGYYGMGLTGKVILGEDISGDEGPPNLNLYALAFNPILPGDYEPEFIQNQSFEEDPDDALAKLSSDLQLQEENLNRELESNSQSVFDDWDQQMDQYRQVGSDTILLDDLIAREEDRFIDSINVDRRQLIITFIQLMAMFSGRDFSEPLAAVHDMSEDEINGLSIDELRDPKGLLVTFLLQQCHVFLEQNPGPINEFLDTVDSVYAESVRTLTEPVKARTDDIITSIVHGVSEELAAPLEDKPEVLQVLQSVEASTIEILVEELHVSMDLAIYTNLTYPIQDYLRNGIQGRINQFLLSQFEQIILTAIAKGENSGSVNLSGIGAQELFEGMYSDAASLLNPEAVISMAEGLAYDLISNIDGTRVIGRLEQALKSALADYTSKKIAEGAAVLANNVLKNELGIEVPIDFGSASGKLLSGESLLSDPVAVKVRSQVMDMNGQIFFTEDHPIYGDIWSGKVDVLVKKPQSFIIQASYMNGRKDGMSYWFAEVGGATMGGENGEVGNISEMGGEMSPDSDISGEGIDLGVARIMALRGRIYHHMRPDGLNDIVPDASHEMGFYLHMVLFGPNDGTKFRLEVDAEANTYESGDLTVRFDGNLQISSPNPQVFTVDQYAAIQGNVSLSYNSFEQHFFGYAEVVLKTDGICGDGSLLVDMKPGAWRIALGNRENPVSVIPACIGVSYHAWLDLDQSSIELGVGLGLAFYKVFGKEGGKINVIVDAAIAAYVFANLGYRPLQVNEVGIFIEMWASLIINYNFKLKKGSVSLLEIYLYAAATMRFNPDPSMLYGELRGYVRLIQIIDINFSENFELEV
jgi:hypothetical protein